MASSTGVESSDDTACADSQQEALQQEIMEECELTWDHIQETHHRLAGYKEDKPPVRIDRSNAALKILQHKEKKLQAQVGLLKNKDVEVVSKDLRFVETVLQSDMKKNISQLRQTLSIVKAQREEVAGDIAWERKLLEEQKAIGRSLQEKIKALQPQEDSGEPQQNSVLAELQAKKKEASQYHLTVMNQLGMFLSNHFPKPKGDSNSDDYCSLQHIIETLMNRLFESPHDSCIKILPIYWPPYIELLLRSNIIQRHPENCNLIRLVAFHA